MAKMREQTRMRVQNCRDRKKEHLLLGEKKVCAYCGDSADTIDHILAKSRGGKDEPENVVAACSFCNSSKKDKAIFTMIAIAINQIVFLE
jgi:5-methylcytosine-specific restriction endonuclease McrA